MKTLNQKNQRKFEAVPNMIWLPISTLINLMAKGRNWKTRVFWTLQRIKEWSTAMIRDQNQCEIATATNNNFSNNHSTVVGRSATVLSEIRGVLWKADNSISDNGWWCLYKEKSHHAWMICSKPFMYICQACSHISDNRTEEFSVLRTEEWLDW